MGFCSQFKALFMKNCILWYRNLGGSLCELLFPLVIMLLLSWARSLISSSTISAQSYLNQSFPYYINENVKMGVPSPIQQFSINATSSPFTECVYLNRFLIGFVGSSSLYNGIQASLFSSSGSNSLLFNFF